MFLSIFLLCPNATLTNLLNFLYLSSAISGESFFVNLKIAESTLGFGMNTSGFCIKAFGNYICYHSFGNSYFVFKNGGKFGVIGS